MPGHKFTQAERAKASATRIANAAQRKLKAQQAVVATATTALASTEDAPKEVVKNFKFTNIIVDEGFKMRPIAFDWWNAPLDVALEHLNDMKREYDRAAQIVLQRQSQLPAKPLTCWVWDHRHRKDVAKTALAQCKRTIPDRAKAAFTNDGYREEGDPPGKVRSIYCCGMTCYMVYNQLRPVGGLSRH